MNEDKVMGELVAETERLGLYNDPPSTPVALGGEVTGSYRLGVDLAAWKDNGALRDFVSWIKTTEDMAGRRSRQAGLAIGRYIAKGDPKDLEHSKTFMKDSVTLLWRVDRVREMLQAHQSPSAEVLLEVVRLQSANPAWEGEARKRAGEVFK